MTRYALPIHLMCEIAENLNNGLMMVRLLTQDTFNAQSPTVRPYKNKPEWDCVVLHNTVEKARVEGIVEYLQTKDSRMCFFEEGPRGGWNKMK